MTAWWEGELGRAEIRIVNIEDLSLLTHCMPCSGSRRRISTDWNVHRTAAIFFADSIAAAARVGPFGGDIS